MAKTAVDALASVELSGSELDDLKVAHSAAVREAQEARQRFIGARVVRVELDRSGVLITPEQAGTRTLRGGRVGGPRLSEEELLVARADTDEACLLAGRELKAATERLRRASAALLQHQLAHGLVEAHEEAARHVQAADARAEAAYIELAVALLARKQARIEEAARAREIVKVAAQTLSHDDERADLRHRAQHSVPVELGEEGGVVAWRDRPVDGLFGLGGNDWNPDGDGFYAALADVVHGGPRACAVERVRTKIVKALEGATS
jgi:hypothetical protein